MGNMLILLKHFFLIKTPSVAHLSRITALDTSIQIQLHLHSWRLADIGSLGQSTNILPIWKEKKKPYCGNKTQPKGY